MLSDLTELLDAQTLEIKDQHWKLMEVNVAPVLEALECATTVISAEREVSIPDRYAIISLSLINIHLNRVVSDTNKEAGFRSKVASSLSKWMTVIGNAYYNNN